MPRRGRVVRVRTGPRSWFMAELVELRAATMAVRCLKGDLHEVDRGRAS